MADDEQPDETTERDSVLGWRFSEALRLGLSLESAESFAAGEGDLERLRVLITRGWLPEDAFLVV